MSTGSWPGGLEAQARQGLGTDSRVRLLLSEDKPGAFADSLAAGVRETGGVFRQRQDLGLGLQTPTPLAPQPPHAMKSLEVRTPPLTVTAHTEG